MKKQAFTLIELLVVIAIIAVLAAVLFPVFAHVRESGRAAVCSSNLKQIGIALSLYAQDYNDDYPQAAVITEKYLQSGRMDRYLPKPGEGVWICPDDNSADGRTPGPWTDPGQRNWSYSQSWQFFLFGDVQGGYGTPPRNLSTVRNPTQTLMIGEPWYYQLPMTRYFKEGIEAARSAGQLSDALGQQHNGRGNYLFADGHIKALTVRQTLTPVVLWDNLRDWCPECDRLFFWGPRDVKQALQILDEEQIP